MSQKRTQDDSSSASGFSKGNLEGVHIPDDKRHKSVPSFRSVVLEVMRQKSFQNALEPMLRRVVKEEVELAIKKHVMKLKRNSDEDLFPCESRNLQLKFLSTLSLPVFTGTRIEGEDGSAIKVVLIDAATDEVVQYANESSAKVEIVVLEGDFDGDEGENWTIEEFKNNIVREREGKKPLLTGDVNVYLKEGIGSVGEISFRDNSSWTRSRRFRLGAGVVGNADGYRIREAKTESFIVRDHRGELYKKHHPPSLTDEVWRLEKIGKDGAFHKRLSIDRVRTVKDFLILLHLDPARLRNILGSGMSAKMWEITIEHARTCVLDKRVYLYYSPMSQHKNGVVFNVVGQVIGFYSESQYIPFDKLSENDKIDAQRMATEAFQHWDGVITFEDMNSLIGMSSHTASSASTETSDANKLVTSQQIGSIDYAQPSTSPSDGFSPLYTLGSLNSPDDYSLPGLDALDLRYDQTLDIPLQISSSLFSPSHSITQAFHDDELLGFMDIDCPTMQSTNMILDSQAELQSVYSGFLRSRPSSQAVRGQAYRRWKVVSSVLRWLVRRAPCPRIQKYR
ncbi:calmodulin-binding protein 60 A-like isoform X1 [Chenopodium quinoa]|uniref:calmodulin-binding protein 60 A-like isoform X1 n=1 Tax=Chenopodium quinoa TaxID=63459 RepID=UPI000B78A342|nr:calmodulin-binding protein 60 A-like isoform X1 [Chenopodium quinoa]